MQVEPLVLDGADSEFGNSFDDTRQSAGSRRRGRLGNGTLAMLRTGWERLTRPRETLSRPPYAFEQMARGLNSGAGAHNLQMGFSDNIVHERSPSVDCPVFRSESESRRLLYVGELTPRSGVLDFLSCAVSWADANPTSSVDILWAGDGDLRGILQAQPVPGNLTQAFDRVPNTAGLPAIFARGGILIVPCLSDLSFSWLPEAMAAGLPILGSVRDSRVRQLVTPGITGWLFDPTREEGMARAFSRAMTATTEQLNAMRMASRARVRPASIEPHVSAEQDAETIPSSAIACL